MHFEKWMDLWQTIWHTLFFFLEGEEGTENRGDLYNECKKMKGYQVEMSQIHTRQSVIFVTCMGDAWSLSECEIHFHLPMFFWEKILQRLFHFS